TVVGTVRGVAKDPIGTAKGTIALGRAVAGQVAGQVTRTIRDRVGGGSSPATRAPGPVPVPDKSAEVTPADVARVVEKKPAAKQRPAGKTTPAKKAPPKKAAAKKAPAKKATPSGKLPAKKAPAKKAPAKKAPPVQEARPVEEAPPVEEAAPKPAEALLEETD